MSVIPSRRPRALLVDPDPLSRLAERAALESDFEVVEVAGAEQALSHVGRFALAVVEHRLAGRSGAELLAELGRADTATHRILLAADADGGVLDAVKSKAAERLLLRPFRPEELRVAARRACDVADDLGRVLCVDDDALLRTMLCDMLAASGYTVTAAADGHEALARLKRRSFDLAIVDLNMPVMAGPELLGRLKAAEPDLPIIVLTSTASTDLAVEMTRRGADDYVLKPYQNEDLLFRVRRVLREKHREEEVRRLRGTARGDFGPVHFHGSSDAIRRVFVQINSVAHSDANVLITGETGTGKELVARAIHHTSPRRAGPWLAINCGALSDALLESELFGHEKGAFTGAVRTRKGLFELAHGGSLLLDEVGELSPALQATILRIIETREFMRVGGEEVLHSDVRILAATHRDLAEMVRQGTFRQDLYFRLNVVSIETPPLRERREDIAALVMGWLDRHAKSQRRPIERISAAAMDAMFAYHWPGNVRELESALERAALLATGPVIEVVELGLISKPHAPRPLDSQLSLKDTVRDATVALEVEYLSRLLRECSGNVQLAAKRAGIDRKSFYRKMQRLRLTAAPFRD